MARTSTARRTTRKAAAPEPVAAPLPTPIPTAVTARWFPAAVQLPDGTPPLRLAKVYATPQGLYVYVRPPHDRHLNLASIGAPEFFSRIDYDKTPTPATGTMARNAGVTVHTEAGTVVVTPLGGCGCAAGSLKHWTPSWAGRSIAWKDATK